MDLNAEVNQQAAVPSAAAADQGDNITTQSPGVATDVTNTSPPSSETPETKETLLSVVQNVVKTEPKDEDVLDPPAAPDDPNKVTPPSAQPNDGKDPNAPTPTAEAEDLTNDELALLRPKARKRFEHLRQQSKDLQSKLDALQPVVEQHQQLNTYLESHRLSNEDFQLGLATMAALRRGDFQTFLQVIRPYAEAAEQALGLRLPEDLNEKVSSGFLPEAEARELARLRSQATMSQETVQELQREQAMQAQTAQATAIKSAVAQWEQGIAGSDPDFGQKRAALEDAVLAMVARQGAPSTPEQALTMAQQAYARVNQTFVSVRQAPRPTRPVPQSGGQNSAPAVAAPKTLMEAALSGLARARAS